MGDMVKWSFYHVSFVNSGNYYSLLVNLINFIRESTSYILYLYHKILECRLVEILKYITHSNENHFQIYE